MGPWEPRPLEAQVVPGGTKIPAGSQECNHSPLTLSPASSSDPKVAPAATDAFSHTRLPVSHCESRPPDHHSTCWLQWSQAVPVDPGSFYSPMLPAGSHKCKVHPTLVPASPSSLRKVLWFQATAPSPGSQRASENSGFLPTRDWPIPAIVGS